MSYFLIRQAVSKIFRNIVVNKRLQVANISDHERTIIGNREIVGFGFNGQPSYVDRSDFPFPAIRWKETTSEIEALREKEKGDWNELTCEEKKALYRIPNETIRNANLRSKTTKITTKKLKDKECSKRLSCTSCPKTYISKKMFEKHKSKCNGEQTNFVPSQSIFTEIKQENVEIRKDANTLLLGCDKCTLSFSQQKDLQQHYKLHSSLDQVNNELYYYKEDVDVYACQNCFAEFYTVMEIENHIKLHGQQSYGCLKCSDKFKSLRALFCHMEFHPEDGHIPCPMCSFKTNKKYKLLGHLRSNHIYVNICETCDKTFYSKANFQRHMLRHDETKKNSCIVCSHVYFGEKALLRHQICMHKADIVCDPSLLWCDICRMEFKTSNLLKYHIEKAHTKNVTKSVEKKCLCDICGQGFKDADNLKKHKKSHTDVRPFNCKECGKAFKHKYVLTYHQRTHTGERPYSCGYCAKSFRQWTPYKVHLRGHTGEKPYVCKVCSKGFTTNQGLKFHLKNCLGNRDAQ